MRYFLFSRLQVHRILSRSQCPKPVSWLMNTYLKQGHGDQWISMVTHGQVMVKKRQTGDPEQFGKRKQDSVGINYHRLHQNVQANGAFLDILFMIKRVGTLFTYPKCMWHS